MLTPLLALLGCAPIEAVDDAGDAAFVELAVPAVLGRKVHGSVELNVLTQLVHSQGRSALLDALFEQPEYADYWTRVLATRIEVSQAGSTAQTGTCFNQLSVMASPYDVTAATALNNHLRNDSASTSYTPSVTMLDVLDAAVVGDDLGGVFRAWPLALAKRQTDGNWTERQVQSAVLGRNPDCQACHTTAWSATDDVGNDRFWPTPINLEKALYGSGGVFNNSCGTDWACLTVQTGTCSGCHGGDGTDPVYGGDGQDKTMATRVPVLDYGRTHGTIQYGTPGGMPDLGFTSTQSDYLLWYVEGQVGYPTGLSAFYNSSTYAGTVTPLGMSTACSPKVNPTFSTSPYIPWFAGQLPSTPSPNDVADAFRDGLSTVSAEVASTGLDYTRNPWETPVMSGPASFAYLAAEHTVDIVAQEIMGARYTLPHGYSRNSWQALHHDILTTQLLSNGWSLRETIRSLVLSTHFNRRAPEASLVTSTAYPLLMMYNPWVATQTPSALGDNRNGTGDLVHRYSPDNLYSSLSRGLGFGQPGIIGNGYYPGLTFQQQIGDYLEFYSPGFDRWSMQSLLYWEASPGTCNATYALSDYYSDWFDYLISDAVINGRTMDQVFSVVKDRILANPSLTATEQSELTALIYPNPMGTIVTGTNYTAIQGWARQYCGALLKTPDYLLAGVSPVTTATNSFPAMEICLVGEPCGIVDVCQYWEDEMAAIGVTWSCDTTPGPSGPADPWDTYASERQLADEWGFTYEDPYADEIAKNRAAEDSAVDTGDDGGPKEDQAAVDKFNAAYGNNADYWAPYNAEAGTWAKEAQARIDAIALQGWEAPSWASEVPANDQAATAERARILADRQAAERACTSKKKKDCVSSTLSPVRDQGHPGSDNIKQKTVDAAEESMEAAVDRAEAEAGKDVPVVPEMQIRSLK